MNFFKIIFQLLKIAKSNDFINCLNMYKKIESNKW